MAHQEITLKLGPPALLTDAEHRCMRLTAELWNLLCGDVVGLDVSRFGDLRELCDHIHAIQHAVLSQAAARAYPDLYRPLGGTLAGPVEVSRDPL